MAQKLTPCVMFRDPATNWFEIVEQLVIEVNSVISIGKMSRKVSTCITNLKKLIFDKSSALFSSLVNTIWFCCCPLCQVEIEQVQIQLWNSLQFKWYQACANQCTEPPRNEIMEQMHQVIMIKFRTSELDMANTVDPSDRSDFLTNPA